MEKTIRLYKNIIGKYLYLKNAGTLVQVTSSITSVHTETGEEHFGAYSGEDFYDFSEYSQFYTDEQMQFPFKPEPVRIQVPYWHGINPEAWYFDEKAKQVRKFIFDVYISCYYDGKEIKWDFYNNGTTLYSTELNAIMWNGTKVVMSDGTTHNCDGILRKLLLTDEQQKIADEFTSLLSRMKKANMKMAYDLETDCIAVFNATEKHYIDYCGDTPIYGATTATDMPESMRIPDSAMAIMHGDMTIVLDIDR